MKRASVAVTAVALSRGLAFAAADTALPAFTSDQLRADLDAPWAALKARIGIVGRVDRRNV